MKCHFFLQAGTPGIIDIDKKLPYLKDTFPKSKIEKKSFTGEYEFLIARDIISDTKLVSFNETACDIQLHFDLYITSLLGMSLLDIQFDITEEMVNVINVSNFLLNSKVHIDGEKQAVAILITKVLFPYYQTDKLLDITSDEKYMELNKSNGERIRERLSDELACKYFFSVDSPPNNMSANPGLCLIEDYENNTTMDSKWEDIGAYKKQVYNHAINKSTFVLKEKKYYKDLYGCLIEMQIAEKTIRYSLNFCGGWLARIGGKVAEIRKNIASSHDNKFYWKELKKNVELIDLNFLEFHTMVTRECIHIEGIPDTLNLELSKEYEEKYTERKMEQKKSLFECLNEIKYAISNLATPGHTHDEHLLQEETEKVHEMLLMISFIAMAIPCGVAITAPNISLIIKIIAAAAIFSIPIIYYTFRKIQKSLAFKRNVKAELKRQYKSISASLVKDKERLKRLESFEEFPEDLKNSIIDLNKKGIDASEKRLEKLKNRI